jgi:hypothetical protein
MAREDERYEQLAAVKWYAEASKAAAEELAAALTQTREAVEPAVQKALDGLLGQVLAEMRASRRAASQNRLLRALMVLVVGFAAGAIAALWILKPRIEDIQWQATNAQTAIYAVWQETTPEGKKAKAEQAKKAAKPKE